jgi:transposase
VVFSSTIRMARTSKRAKLILNLDQKQSLEQTAQSRTQPHREVQRAQILLRYASGQSVTAIAQALRLSRVAVYKWIDRASALGVEGALRDQCHRPKEPTITRSWEFILLLQALDAHYPPSCVIRLVLDNHSSHISKETMAWLASRPNRFVYGYTPKHGSWLNLIETLFGKMARTFLKHIRVGSLQELKDRILLGVAEINQEPVVYRWKNFEALNT